MSRFITLNGPPGIGKSTLARRYVDEHPGVLNLDIDIVRTLIGGWRGDFAGAGALARPMALSMAETHLMAGHDVVMPQYLGRLEEIAKFEAVAHRCSAAFVEVVITDERAGAVARFGRRGSDDQEPWHDQVREIVASSGGIGLLEEMYDKLVAVVAARPAALLLQSREGEIDAAYSALVGILGQRD